MQRARTSLPTEPAGAQLMTLARAAMPPEREMQRAMLEADSSYDGVFFTAVKTTGIFCRPSCSARKPRRQNVEFFSTARDALFAGYRACLRCRPLEPAGQVPGWLRSLLDQVEKDPLARWTDADLRHRGVDPSRVRRWFNKHHGMTFHAYQRARRLGRALGQLSHGVDMLDVAYEHGYESLSGFRDAFEQLFGGAPGRVRGRERVVVNRLLTPLGPMLAGATEAGLCLLEFADRRMLQTQVNTLVRRLQCAVTPGSNEHLHKTAVQLREYFAGTRQRFDVPLVMPGTEFQQAAWEQLLRIPYGATVSYQQQAKSIGRQAAVRAVGRANGENRIAILVPCHRVVGKDGRLHGYGGGLWRKRLLLELETVQLEAATALP